MPTGKMKWFDSESGQARIVARSGHEFAALACEVETAARTPRARVIFDVIREGGIARAANVRLHRGTEAHPGRAGLGTPRR